MGTWQFFFPARPERSELLLAWLEDFPFDAFQETEEGLFAYLAPGASPESVEEQLRLLPEDIGIPFRKELIPAQNWNSLWEENFSPVRIGDFCGIRATFHQPFQGVLHELVIQPKMAFGTGHHETTFMMVALMENLHFSGSDVFDFGCGTGILAILAAKLGATAVDAVDIEEAAVENTLENAAVNQTREQVRVFEGDLDVVPFRQYDCILANINRNVILGALTALYNRLRGGGTLLISGILDADRELVFEAAREAGFHINHYTGKGNWIAASLTRPLPLSSK